MGRLKNAMKRRGKFVECLPDAKIERVKTTVRKMVVENKLGPIIVHVGMRNITKDGTVGIISKFRELLGNLKKAKVGHILISGILPAMGSNNVGYMNCKRMAFNTQLETLCR